MPYILELRDFDGISTEHQSILSLENNNKERSLCDGLIKIAEALYSTSQNKPNDLAEKIEEINEAYMVDGDSIGALQSITISPSTFYINSKYRFYALTKISEDEYEIYLKNKDTLHLL